MPTKPGRGENQKNVGARVSVRHVFGGDVSDLVQTDSASYQQTV